MEDSPVQLQAGLNGGLQNQFVDQLQENSETKKNEHIMKLTKVQQRMWIILQCNQQSGQMLKYFILGK